MPTRQKEADAKKQEKGAEGQASDHYNSGDKDATDCTSCWDDPEIMERNQKEYKKFLEDNRKARKMAQEEQHSGDAIGKKHERDGHASHADAERPNKKQKGKTGKQKEAKGAAGSITRVPKEGQQVQWHSLPGWIDGEVVEVLYEEKEVNGKTVKASKEDPRIVLESAASGKVCVHKPGAVYF